MFVLTMAKNRLALKLHPCEMQLKYRSSVGMTAHHGHRKEFGK